MAFHFRGGKKREGGRRRLRGEALCGSLMDFVSGGSVSNHAFIMGGWSLAGVVIDNETPQHVKFHVLKRMS